MNAIYFQTKRALHGFLRVTRKPLNSLAAGLTAARFDLLYVVMTGNGTGVSAQQVRLQHAVQRALGVSAPVVSRMMRSLEKLGWVVRNRCPIDRRKLEVRLTRAGRACICNAYQALKEPVARLVYKAICFGRHRDAGQRLEHMDTLEGYLRSMKDSWGDRSQLYYAWGHPDD